MIRNILFLCVETNKFMLLFAAGGENLALYLKSALEDKEKGNAYPFIIYDKLKGAYAGGHEKHRLYGRR